MNLVSLVNDWITNIIYKIDNFLFVFFLNLINYLIKNSHKWKLLSLIFRFYTKKNASVYCFSGFLLALGLNIFSTILAALSVCYISCVIPYALLPIRFLLIYLIYIWIYIAVSQSLNLNIIATEPLDHLGTCKFNYCIASYK